MKEIVSKILEVIMCLIPFFGKNIWKLLSKPLTLTIKVWITT